MTLQNFLPPSVSLLLCLVAVTGCKNDEDLTRRVRALEEFAPSHAHPRLVMGVKGCKRRSLEPTLTQRVLIEQMTEKDCTVESLLLDPDGAACPADYDIVVKWGIPVRLPDGGVAQLENGRIEVRGVLVHPDGAAMLPSRSLACLKPGYASEVWVVPARGFVP